MMSIVTLCDSVTYDEHRTFIRGLVTTDVCFCDRSYNGVLQRLYTGIQCSSCGVRFMAADTEQYREHLDWHFRQNRKEKEEIKVAKFRRWYYAAAVSHCCSDDIVRD